jgi:hypothetical protein
MSIFGGVLYLGVDQIKQVYVYIWRGASNIGGGEFASMYAQPGLSFLPTAN